MIIIEKQILLLSLSAFFLTYSVVCYFYLLFVFYFWFGFLKVYLKNINQCKCFKMIVSPRLSITYTLNSNNIYQNTQLLFERDCFRTIVWTWTPTKIMHKTNQEKLFIHLRICKPHTSLLKSLFVFSHFMYKKNNK